MKFNDLNLIHKNIKNEILGLFEDCIENSNFILGKYVDKIEKQVSEFLNIKYSLGVASGTDALMISLMALGIKAGDEVITTPFTFIATAEVISVLGAKPIFVDVNPKTYNIDETKIEAKITNRTKAIIPVHLYGQMANMVEINKIAKKHNLFIIEDSAQAIGASIDNKKVGSFGDICALSFFPSKNLGCFGDGGMIITNKEKVFNKSKMIRVHGQSKKYYHQILGVNGRLDNLQAAVLSVKIQKLDSWINKRISIAEKYNKKLNNIGNIKIPFVENKYKHVYNQYSLLVENREKLVDYLKEYNIPTAIHYPIPLHLQPAFEYLNYKKNDLPISEQISKKILSLPIYPGFSEENQNFVIQKILNFYKK